MNVNPQALEQARQLALTHITESDLIGLSTVELAELYLMLESDRNNGYHRESNLIEIAGIESARTLDAWQGLLWDLEELA